MSHSCSFDRETLMVFLLLMIYISASRVNLVCGLMSNQLYPRHRDKKATAIDQMRSQEGEPHSAQSTSYVLRTSSSPLRGCKERWALKAVVNLQIKLLKEKNKKKKTFEPQGLAREGHWYCHRK
jgi:hypothetical protein